MKVWILALTVGMSWIVASAQDCYEITGWSTSPGCEQANLLPVSCDCTPSGSAWLFIELSYDGTPPTPDLYLRIDTSDSHMNNGVFSPLLLFSHYDAGVPVVKIDVITGTRQPANSMQSTVNPPVQGPVSTNDRVRLRHRNTGKCLVSQNINGAKVRNYQCADDPAQIYVLLDAGAGKKRLQHEASIDPPHNGQCLYTLEDSGATVHNWVCWPDPGMEFELVPSLGGYRLQNVQDNQCVYGNPQNGGLVHSWVCWNHDPNMVYRIDSVQC